MRFLLKKILKKRPIDPDKRLYAAITLLYAEKRDSMLTRELIADWSNRIAILKNDQKLLNNPSTAERIEFLEDQLKEFAFDLLTNDIAAEIPELILGMKEMILDLEILTEKKT